MNIKQLKRWEKTRAKGKFRFALLIGVIRGAFPVYIICLITMKSRYPTSGFFSIFSFTSLIIALLTFSIAGYFGGVCIWNGYEQEYLLRKDELTKSEEKKERQASP